MPRADDFASFFKEFIVRHFADRLRVELRFYMGAHMKEPTSVSRPRSTAEPFVPTFLRLPMVLRTTGLGRSTIYKLISENRFPGPVRLGARAVAWRTTEVDRWSEERERSTAASLRSPSGRQRTSRVDNSR